MGLISNVPVYELRKCTLECLNDRHLKLRPYLLYIQILQPQGAAGEFKKSIPNNVSISNLIDTTTSLIRPNNYHQQQRVSPPPAAISPNCSTCIMGRNNLAQQSILRPQKPILHILCTYISADVMFGILLSGVTARLRYYILIS